MRSLWIWVIILFCVVSPSAQTVNLTGIVTDSASDSPLSGVIVGLATLGYKDTTGSDGKYSLKSPPVFIIAGKSIGATPMNPRIFSGFLLFNLPQKEKITAAIYSPAGRAIGTIIDQELAPGTYRVTLPSIQKSAGIYYIKVTSGNSQKILKFLSVNEKQGQNRSMNQSIRLNKKLATFVDTLLFEKTGYIAKNVPITTYESAMNITMTLAAPSAPVISGVATGNSSATVIWSAVTGVTSYNLYYKAGTIVDMTSGTKLTGVTSPKQVTGLINGTQYAFAVSAVNAGGESGLSGIDTATLNIFDIDGNVYHTVTIGTQVWMVENLKTTKYNDGTMIPLVTDSAAWDLRAIPGYCYYNNISNADSIKKFGALYNWYAVDTKKLAPIGWHVPDTTEWNTLQNYLIANGYNWDGTTTGNKIAKAMAAQTDWSTFSGAGVIGNDLTNNNRSGFSALPGGYRNYLGNFKSIGDNGHWWSATESGASSAYTYNLDVAGGDLYWVVDNSAFGFSVRCVKGIPAPVAPIAPTIATVTVGDGSATVSWGAVAGATSYNLYYATGATVTISGTKLTSVTSPKQVTGLTDGTQYAFAVSEVNAGGESGLSNVVTATPNVVDIDGNVYHTVKIGTQVWMVENLKTRRYNNGAPIPLDTNSSTWGGLTTGAYCWYNNDSVSNKNAYGALYNWYAVSIGKLAPTGWHVPTDSEWTVLTMYVNNTYYGGLDSAGGALKSTGTTYWPSPNTSSTNSSGFSALPGGYRNGAGPFGNIGFYGYWWSSTAYGASNSWDRSMEFDGAFVSRSFPNSKTGFSVRCVRDN